MTQVKEMTNPELNRKLAELMGYTVVEERKGFKLLTPEGDRVSKNSWINEKYAWDDRKFSSDPAASLEVQAAAIAKDKEAYIRNWLLCKYGKPITYYTSVSLPVAAEIADSKPRERAEAAYQTLSGEQ